jgi:hypothetical protein
VQEIAAGGAAGVGDDEIQPSERLGRLVDEPLELRVVGDVDGLAVGGDASRLELGDRGRDRVGVAGAERECATFGGEPVGDAAADAAGRSGDERDPSRELAGLVAAVAAASWLALSPGTPRPAPSAAVSAPAPTSKPPRQPPEIPFGTVDGSRRGTKLTLLSLRRTGPRVVSARLEISYDGDPEDGA